MAVLTRDGYELSYEDRAGGDPAILIHGFAASASENWHRPGWTGMLSRASRRVVTLDLRGHGQSQKSDRPQDYAIAAFADDVVALADHLALKKPDLIGFSLGGRVVLEVLRRHGSRFLLGVVIGGGGRWLEQQDRDPEILPRAMEAEDPSQIADTMARQFRLFADGQGQDRASLAACARGLALEGLRLDPDALGRIGNEIHVVAGAADELAGDPAPLGRALGHAKAVRVPGCGHMDCLVQPMVKGAVMDFLDGTA